MLTLSLIAPSLCSGSEQEWRWYENEEWGYKVKYPSDWNNQTLQIGLSQVFDALNIGEDPSLSFHVACSKAHFKGSLYKQIMEEGVERLKKDYPDYTCLEITNITLDGFPAVKIVAAYTDARTESPPSHTKEIYIVSAREGITYGINFSVNTPDAKKTERYFDEYLPLANEMIDSFKFI
jgi:hypothetical protein